MRRVSYLVLAAGVLLSACERSADEDAGDTPWQTVSDTTGDTVRVRITGPVPDRLVRSLVLELRVGAQDGAEEETFGSVDDVLGTDDGGLLIHDTQARVIRIFGPDGKFVRQLGGRGGGPGEYGWVNGIARTASGEWAVWDADGGRLNLYAANGDFLRNLRVPITGWYRFSGVHADSSGRLYVWAPLARDSTTGQLIAEGYAVLDASGTVGDSVPLPSWGPEPPILTAQSADGGSTTNQQLPWTWGSESVLMPDGGLASGSGPEYVFYVLPRGGRPVRVEREYEPVSISRTESSERKAQLTQRMRRVNPSWDWTGPEMPTVKPAYRQLLAGADGHVWIRLWTAGEPIPPEELPDVPPVPDPPVRLTTREPNLYDVFAADGRLLGRVAPPPRTRLLRMSGDQVWGVMQDSLDVSYAVRFRISPPLPD